jgi:hypothetical protein
MFSPMVEDGRPGMLDSAAGAGMEGSRFDRQHGRGAHGSAEPGEHLRIVGEEKCLSRSVLFQTDCIIDEKDRNARLADRAIVKMSRTSPDDAAAAAGISVLETDKR